MVRTCEIRQLDLCEQPETAERWWREIQARRGAVRFYQEFDWVAAACRHLGDEVGDSRLFFAFENDAPRVVFWLTSGLAERRCLTYRVWRTPEHLHLPLVDLLSVDDDDLRWAIPRLMHYLAQKVDRQWRALMFGHIPDSSALVRMRRYVTRPVFATAMGGRGVIVLDDSWDNLRRHFPRKHRARLRKAQVKLAEMPDVEVVRIREPDALAEAYRRFLEVECSGWKGGTGECTAILLHKSLHDFYRDVVERFGKSGRFEINLLLIGDQTVAGQLCLIEDRTLCILKIGYDESYRQFSPGNILIEHVLREAIESNRYSEIDFISWAPWQRDWSPQYRDRFALTIPGKHWRGRVFGKLFQGINWLISPSSSV